VFAWDSVTYGIHEGLTDDAITAVSKKDYPDIWKFKEQVLAGSSIECHNESVIDTSNLDNLNDGYPEAWWNKGIDPENNPDNAVYHYKQGNFAKAYTCVGMICHLIEDVAVPAHAANIPHGLLFGMDSFELAANTNFSHYKVKPNKKGKTVYDYYYLIRDDTINELEKRDWIDPVSKKDYWLLDKFDNKPDGYGEYGGVNNTDIYNYSAKNGPEILVTQLKKSASYTAGTMIKASMSFPPVVTDVQIEKISNEPANKNKYKISFKVLENREPKIKILMSIDTSDNNYVKCDDYSYKKKFLLDSGKDMVWEKSFVFYWQGELSNKNKLLSGEHVLFVKVKDQDGNMSDELTCKFVYEKAD
jgi:hypothetical protein